MLRPFTITYEDTGQTSFSYNDTSFPVSVMTTKKLTGTTNITNISYYDGLGQVQKTQLLDLNDGDTFVDTIYDLLGRVASVSNPHRSASAPTDGITQYQYDALGRKNLEIPPDGSATANNIQTGYGAQTTGTLGLTTTVTDQALTSRTNVTDALGRLVTVWEAPGGANYQTNYQYDALDNLICAVQQGTDATAFKGCNSTPPPPTTWRPRSFVYDSLSRFTSATNPESGTITYQYDNDSNVQTKTAPSPNQPSTGTAIVTTTYSYDAINRLTGKSYLDGYTSNPSTASIAYGYDGANPSGCTPTAISGPINLVNRRSGMCDAAGSAAWSYDPLGRAQIEQRVVNGAKKIFNYSYNLDGSLYTLSYPSGRVVTYAPNGAGRPLSAEDTTSGNNYVSSATYAPQGALATLQNGPYIHEAFTYNSRLQPLQIYATAGTISPTTLSQLALGSCPSATATIMSRIYGLGLSTNDNGNVDSITNCRDTNRTQHFDYDGLNRIFHGYTSGPNWGEVYGRDTWGNLTSIQPYLNPGESFSASVNVYNQLVTYGYDPAGNMTSNNGASYAYDAENRLVTFGGAYSYVYDGDGKRVKKCALSGSTCTSGTLYFTGTGNDALLETDLTGAGVEEYIFFNGKRVARRDTTGGLIHYYFSDHLGSHTVIQSGDGSTCEHDIDYYPYGGQEQDYCGGPVQNYKFNGKERDTESNLDEFGARYYASVMGRFMTPDWAATPIDVPYASFGNPQSLNLYSYVKNNPTTFGDPDGHCVEDACVMEVAFGAYALYQLTASPAGQQAIRNGINALLSTPGLIRNTFSSENSSENNKQAPPPAATPSPSPQAGEGDPHAPGDVPNGQSVVRGGQGAIPSSGTYSGAQGATIEEAGKGVPNGTISATTGGAIRAAGGEVRPAPEAAYEGGPINGQHVNITGGQSSFGPQQANPAPRSERVPGGKTLPKPPKPNNDSN